jgi:hypothetical protein
MNNPPVTRKLIRVDGAESPLPGKLSIREVCELIGAECLDSVNLPDHIHVMLVDDTGMVDGRPINPKATAIYHDKCGRVNEYSIHGDVVIVPDSDFGGLK